MPQDEAAQNEALEGDSAELEDSEELEDSAELEESEGLEESEEERSVEDEADYVCGACGEAIVIPVDLSGGAEQEYVEDCPVCCRANVIQVHLDREGHACIRSYLE